METKICCGCKGSGEIREDVGGHESEYEYHQCSSCRGTGRELAMSYSFSVPFDVNKTRLYEADSEIIDIIRKLQSELKTK